MLTLVLHLLAIGASPAAARDVIVHVAIVDHLMFTRESHDARVEALRRVYPDARVEDVLVVRERDQLLRSPVRRAIRAEVRARLRQVPFGPDDAVSMLVIATHGSGSSTGSSLETFAKFLGHGPVAKLRRVFRPLLGHVKRDASVVLISCSTMNGRADAVHERVGALMRWLGAPDGALVGFRGPVMPSGPPRPRLLWSRVDRTYAVMGALATAGAVADTFSAPETLGLAALGAGVTLGVKALARANRFRAIVRRNRADSDLNVAWVMRLANGRVVATERFGFLAGSTFGCAPELLADSNGPSTAFLIPITKISGQ